MPSSARWMQIWYADGRKDAHGSFTDVYEDAFDLDDLAKQYEAVPDKETEHPISSTASLFSSRHHEAAKEIAQRAYAHEYEQLSREGTLREEWDNANDDVIDEMEEDGVDPDLAFAEYQRGYADQSIVFMVDDILERHAELVEEGEFDDEDDDDGEQLEADEP